jgi:branched-chain amino acid transport system ATP-binding protein
MLKIQNLNAGYGEIQILKDVNLEVNAGEIVALLGGNGAGKSTLIKSVFKLADIFSGEILYEGKIINDLKIHELIDLGIYYLSQGKINFQDMTVRENLEAGLLFREDKELIAKRLGQVLEQFPDLAQFLDRKAYVLSGGQQQMLAFGRALMYDPELLLLDEPTLGLSPKLIKESFELIRKMKHEFNITVLVVEHNIKSVLEICDRAYLMTTGEVRWSGNAKDTPLDRILE